MLITKLSRSTLASIVARPMTKRCYAAAANSEVFFFFFFKHKMVPGKIANFMISLLKRPLCMISMSLMVVRWFLLLVMLCLFNILIWVCWHLITIHVKRLLFLMYLTCFNLGKLLFSFLFLV